MFVIDKVAWERLARKSNEESEENFCVCVKIEGERDRQIEERKTNSVRMEFLFINIWGPQ